MYRTAILLKRIKIKTHQCVLLEDNPKRVKTYWSRINPKIIYNIIVHFVCFVLYSYQLNYSNIEVHRNTAKPAQH